MIELVKLIMAKPLQGLVAALSVISFITYIGLSEVRLAMAVLEEQQRVDLTTNKRFLDTANIIIRIDENLKLVKEGQVFIKENQKQLRDSQVEMRTTQARIVLDIKHNKMEKL